MIKQLLEEARISDELYDSVYNNAPLLEVQKGDTLLRSNQLCEYIYLIEEGLLRMYLIDENGNDITQWFAFEDTLITAGDSFFDRTKSRFFIEAIEKSSVKLMTLDTLNNLCDVSHEFERFTRLIIQNMFLELTYRLEDQHFKSAKERYLALLDRYPSIAQRVNLGHIASYIGIAQQSLSRIRSNL